MDLVLILVGLLLLAVGAELLIRGASRLARAFGISPLIVGLTVVALGTSSPEMAVNIRSAAVGNPDVAIGNVIGSNVGNILVILGLSAVVAPLVVHQRLVRLDVPLMIGLSILVLLLALDGELGRLDAILLVSGLVAYLVWAVWTSRSESDEVLAEYAAEFGNATPAGVRLLWNGALALIGLALLAFGSNWLVDGAVAVARTVGVTDLIIGLTLVAAGTSMPELATSIVASIRGERDIAVGNAVGSNIFNLLAVLGISALVAPEGLPVASSVLRVDLPVMIVAAAVALPIFFTGHRIVRWEGALFLALYVAYITYLYLSATNHAALGLYVAVALGLIFPLLAIALVTLAAREYQAE